MMLHVAWPGQDIGSSCSFLATPFPMSSAQIRCQTLAGKLLRVARTPGTHHLPLKPLGAPRTPCLAHRVPLCTSRCPMRDPGTQRCPLRSSNAGWWAGSRRGSRCDSWPLKSDLSSVLRARTRPRQSAQARRSRQRLSPLRRRGPSNRPSRCFPRRQVPWSLATPLALRLPEFQSHFCNT